MEKNTFGCRICFQVSNNPSKVYVKGAVRLLADQMYTVWECEHCRTLNALETVRYDHIYLNYPIQKQKYDFFSKAIFRKRLDILRQAGLTKKEMILDFGCGSGYFVRFLREQGFNCEGYDPYNQNFNTKDVLDKRYDLVLSQDVIEHLDDPRTLLHDLKELVKDEGLLVIGTPFSEETNMFDIIDQLGVLHQPYHRFIISKKIVRSFFESNGWCVNNIIETCYMDTWVPFVNSQFLFQLFKSGNGFMDVAFEPIKFSHWIKHPSLIFWGIFGNFFSKKQDLFIFLRHNKK